MVFNLFLSLTWEAIIISCVYLGFNSHANLSVIFTDSEKIMVQKTAKKIILQKKEYLECSQMCLVFPVIGKCNKPNFSLFLNSFITFKLEIVLEVSSNI